jgi:pSer/pThr/pTyr-binding forkhead associated (FHA) protein
MCGNVYVMDAVNGSPTLGTIIFLTGPLAGSTLQINKPTVTIGREPNNDIVIPDPSVSRHHAQITINKSVWSISKLTPQNIIKVNQKDVQQSALQDRDTVGLGAATTFRVQLQSGNQQSLSSAAAVAPPPPSNPQVLRRSNPPSQDQPPRPPQGAPPVPGYMPTVEVRPGEFVGTIGTNPISSHGSLPRGIPILEVSANTDKEKHPYPLTSQVINIGRDPSNDIVINKPTVSGFHAQIVNEGNQLVFYHPHPTRGKTLNGLTYQGRVIAGDERFRKVLERGDLFRITDEHGTFVTLAYDDGTGVAQEILPEIRPLPLGAPVITIGRAPDNMVVLNHLQVSGHHARLEQTQG